MFPTIRKLTYGYARHFPDYIPCTMTYSSKITGNNLIVHHQGLAEYKVM